MSRIFRDYDFEEDIELMNIKYQMNTGNFINFEEDINLNNKIENQKPKYNI